MQSYASWHPSRRAPGFVDLVELRSDSSGLLLVLEPFDVAAPPGPAAFSRAEIRFRLPRALREIDEGYRLSELALPEDEPDCFVYTVDDSSFLQELQAMSLGTIGGLDLVHWFVPSANACVDVLSEVEPQLVVRAPSAS